MHGWKSILSCQYQRGSVDTWLVYKLTYTREDTAKEVERAPRVESEKAGGLVGCPFRVARKARSRST